MSTLAIKESEKNQGKLFKMIAYNDILPNSFKKLASDFWCFKSAGFLFMLTYHILLFQRFLFVFSYYFPQEETIIFIMLCKMAF